LALPETAPDAGLESLLQGRGPVLVFLPNTNELQRFVWPDAFAALGREHQLHYVLPSIEAQKMLAAAPGTITAANSTVIDVPAERFKKWAALFQSACVRYASVSPSFALRASIEPNPEWRELWEGPVEARAEMDAGFDADVAATLQGMEPLPAILELLERVNPVFCVVPTSLLDLLCNEVVWACERANVTCLLLQSGWDNLSSKGLLPWRTPFLGCWGPQSREHAKVVQRLHRKQLGLLGAPHYEFLRPAPEADARALRASLGVADDERLILFGGSFRQFDETGTLERLEEAIGRGKLGRVKIVYRPHPWRAARQHEDSFFSRSWTHVVFDPDMRERYEREQAEAGYIKRNVPMFDMVYLSRLLSAADAVISPMSTLLVEALLLAKPTMAIAFGDGKHRYDPSVTAQMTHFAELGSSGALHWCDEPDRLLAGCRHLLNDEIQADAKRRQLVGRIVVTGPGTYAERLAEFCRTTIEPRGRKQRAERAAATRDTISHAYGAHLIAREYCGVTDPETAVPDYWMHGWIPEYHNQHPALIALHKKEGQEGAYDFAAQILEEKSDTIQWVSREDQAAFLRRHGYLHVKAIGLPIAYLPPPRVRRVPGSLLVLPPHSHKNHGPDDPLAEEYAEMIAALEPRFSRIAVGVNEDDMAKNQWVESFRRRGIDVFVTTDQADPNTLVRLRRILGMFEYVTTNGFGSHIALAAYSGAKVSVYGPFAEFPLERMKSTHAVKMFPELLDAAHYLCTEAALREHYPFLFVEPDQARLQAEWAAREVGEPSRLPPAELRRLFGWDHEARGDAAERAARLAASKAPLVLVAMAHAGFVRNFESVIAGLLDAGVHVHLRFSKEHDTIALTDYPLLCDTRQGRLSWSTSAVTDNETPSGAVDRIRVLRDLVLYSRPQYAEAVDLRARFVEMHGKSAVSVEQQKLLAQLLRWTPRVVKNALDAYLARQDDAFPAHEVPTRLVDLLRPDYVVATPVVQPFSKEVDVLKAARARGIRTLLAVASWDNLTNKGRLHIQPDRVAVWNEAMAREATELHGVPADRIWITGAPLFDPWFERAPRHSRQAFCRELGFDPARPIVVYLCSSFSIAGPSEPELIAEWLTAVTSASAASAGVPPINVLVRPHPMAVSAWAATASADERGRAEWRGGVVWPLSPKHPTTAETREQFFDTLYHADAVVGLNTSAMIEAAILGRPVLTFTGHRQASSQAGNLHFRHLTGSGFLQVAGSLDEHVRELAVHLRQPSAAVEAAARFVASFVRPRGRDVAASAVLVDLILADMGLGRDAAPVAARAPRYDDVTLSTGSPA
jgi:hypothetical protein